jgi:hypothetical protein
MATRILEVRSLKPGANYLPGTLGRHHLVFFPKAMKVLGVASNGRIISNVDVERGDVLSYNCGEVKVLPAWRARLFKAIGYLPVEIRKDIPVTHDEGTMYDHNKRSSRGDFYRRVNKDVCLVFRGRYNDLFSWGYGYVACVIANSPKAIFELLDNKEFRDMLRGGREPICTFNGERYCVREKGNPYCPTAVFSGTLEECREYASEHYGLPNEDYSYENDLCMLETVSQSGYFCF